MTKSSSLQRHPEGGRAQQQAAFPVRRIGRALRALQVSAGEGSLVPQGRAEGG